MSADLQEAQERIREWLAEGHIAFNEGRVDEAMAIADSALESHPFSTEAMNLKSLCYERLGKVAEALQYAERVVELNNDSELDKIRRNNLRSSLGSGLQLTDKQDRRYALLIAASAFAIVFAVMVYGWVQFKGTPSQVTVKNEPAPVERPTTFNTSPNASAPSSSVIPFINNPAAQPAQTQSQTSNAQPTSTDSSDDGSQGIPLQHVNGDQLPSAGDSSSEISVQPVAPPLTVRPDALGSGGSSQDAEKGSLDPSPQPDSGASAETAKVSTPAAKVDDPGQISITVHRGPAIKPIGGSEPVGQNGSGQNGAEALSRTGTQQFLLGNYSAAAASFDHALKMGGDPIRLNQRLGQAYEKLGKTAQALAAYQNAIGACKDALMTGKGDKAKIQATLDACVQADKVLGG